MALRTIELFAGIGGFRLGLERVRDPHGNPVFKTIWNNQWEPGEKAQYASGIYQRNFGTEGHCNEDIERVIATRFSEIPDHDLLVGGFPCQDYSVARALGAAEGLVGQKGVLWWSIHGILERKRHKPKYLLLENVDRLLKSPVKQRGRDFAVMLASLADLGYAVEWRVVNAADYGLPQRRRRVFLIGYHQSSDMYRRIIDAPATDHLLDDGPMAQALPCEADIRHYPESFELEGDLAAITNSFNQNGTGPEFHSCGLMVGRQVTTLRTLPVYAGPRQTLGEVLQPLSEVSKDLIIPKTELKKWDDYKGAKRIQRTAANGHAYLYSEGAMPFPDPKDRPSRTIVTGEGGSSASRMRHVVEQKGVMRRLSPVELERLMGFPDGHTVGVTPVRRAHLLGNALVVGIVERIGRGLYEAVCEPSGVPEPSLLG
jgi:DNA (cytosine-5)-methyltransferase 1